jgi:hypothetical protein
MKSVLYYYNTVEGEEEIHEDEEVEKLVRGENIERNSEYWRIVDVVKPVAEVEADVDTIDLDVIRVYLAGPQPANGAYNAWNARPRPLEALCLSKPLLFTRS